MTDIKKIKFGDFVDKDTASFSDIVNVFDELNKAFENTAKESKKRGKAISEDIESIVGSAKKLKNALGDVKIESPESSSDIEKLKKQLEGYKQKIKDLKKEKVDLTATEKALNAEQAKQQRLLGKQAIQTSEIVKANEKLNLQIQKETKERKKLLKIEQSQNKVKDEDVKLTEAQEGSIDELNGVLSINIALYTKLTKEQRENEAVGGKLLKSIQKQDAELKNLKKEYGDTKASVGNYKDSVIDALDETGLLSTQTGELGQAFSLLKNGFKTAISGLTSFKGALISTGIGALVVALGLIYIALTQTSKGAETFKRVSGGLGQVLNLVVGYLGKMGNALINVKETISSVDIAGTLKAVGKELLVILKNTFIDPFIGLSKILEGVFTFDLDKIKGGFDKATTILQKGFNFVKKTATDAGSEIKKAFDLGVELANIIIDNNKLNRILGVQIVQTAALAQLRRDQQDDDKKGFEERLGYAKKAEQLIRDRFALELKVQRNNLNALNKEIKLRKDNDLVIEEQLDQQKDVLKEIAQLEGDFTQDLRDQIELRSMLITDQFELELDVTEKINAVRLANLAEVAADEKKTTEERAKALNDYKELSNKTFEEAKKGAVTALTEIRIQQLKSSKAEKEAFEAVLKARGLINSEGKITGKLTEDEIKRYAEINENIEYQNKLKEQGFDIQKLLSAQTSEQFQEELKRQDIIEKGGIRILDLWVQNQENVKTITELQKTANNEIIESEADKYKRIATFRKLSINEATIIAEDQLEVQKDLLKQQLITEEQYQSQKNEIIAKYTAANIEEETKYREILASPITSTILNESIKLIENEVVKAGLLAYTNALQEGKGQPEAAKAGFTALTTTQIIKSFAKVAKKDGGTVMGAEGLVWMNEEGHEFVLDHSTTKELGLHNNASMSDFHDKISSIKDTSYIDAMSEVSKKVMNVTQQINFSMPTASEIGQEVGKNMPYAKLDFYDKHLRLLIKSENKTHKEIIYKDHKRHL